MGVRAGMAFMSDLRGGSSCGGVGARAGIGGIWSAIEHFHDALSAIHSILEWGGGAEAVECVRKWWEFLGWWGSGQASEGC